jgi:hypothetical protein
MKEGESMAEGQKKAAKGVPMRARSGARKERMARSYAKLAGKKKRHIAKRNGNNPKVRAEHDAAVLRGINNLRKKA